MSAVMVALAGSLRLRGGRGHHTKAWRHVHWHSRLWGGQQTTHLAAGYSSHHLPECLTAQQKHSTAQHFIYSWPAGLQASAQEGGSKVWCCCQPSVMGSLLASAPMLADHAALAGLGTTPPQQQLVLQCMAVPAPPAAGSHFCDS